MYTYLREKKQKMVKPWDGKVTPFKMAGNIYFVGTLQASAHIIDTGEGLIFVDPGYSDTLYLVVDSIYKLGYKVTDIKYIVNTHWHYDHVEATEALADLSGAKTIIGEIDAPYLSEYGYFKPDILVKDGEVLELGNTKMRFIHTPGHTKGTISFVFETEIEGKTYLAGMHGGAGANSLTVTFPTYYDGARNDYLESIEKLRKEKVQIFMGNHTWNNDTLGKAEKLLENGEDNPFIDEDAKEWNKFLDFCEERRNAVEEREKNL